MKQIVSRFRTFDKQSEVLRSDDGIDFVIAGIGGGKSVIASRKILFQGMRHPRQRNGAPTEWLVLGRDYKLVKDIQLEYIANEARNLCYVTEPEVAEVSGSLEIESRDSWAFAGEDSELVAAEPFPLAPVAARVGKWLGGSRYLVRRFKVIPEKAIIERFVGGSDPCLELTTGVVFRGFSSTDVSRMKGFGFHGGWMDEAEYQSEDGFEMALNRQRSGQVRRLIVSSSPEVASRGWVYRVISGKFPRWDPVRRANKFRSFRWGSGVNPTNSPEQLAGLRAVMEAVSPGRSMSEIDGLFVGTDEAPGVGPIDYTRAFCGRVTIDADDATPDVLGADIGETRDFTWITILSRTGVVLYMERFNKTTPGRPREGFIPYVEQRIEQIARQWRVRRIVIDAAKVGVAVLEHVQITLRPNHVVDGYRTDAHGKKSALIESLGGALSRGDIRVPTAWTGPVGSEQPVEFTDYLRRELSELVVTDVGEGKRRFDHPEGAHDDGIISLGLAYYGLTDTPELMDDLSRLLPGGGSGRSSGSVFGGSRSGGYTF